MSVLEPMTAYHVLRYKSFELLTPSALYAITNRTSDLAKIPLIDMAMKSKIINAQNKFWMLLQ